MIALDQAGQAVAWTDILEPPPSLTPWVEHAWITRLPERMTKVGAGGNWKVVPDLSPNLLVHRTTDGTSLRLVGPRTRAKDVDVQGRLWSVGIRFHPGTLSALVRAEAHELADRSCDPGRFLGPLEGLRTSLATAPGPDVALAALFGFLRALPKASESLDWRVRILTGTPSRATPDRVASLAGQHGISRRTLQSTSLRELGMTPKTVLRIRRLYGALRAALSGREARWSRIAHGAGYCDGPHLSREFKALMQEEPTAWIRRARPLDYDR